MSSQSFYSPTDRMVSPCTAKLHLAKKKHFAKCVTLCAFTIRFAYEIFAGESRSRSLRHSRRATTTLSNPSTRTFPYRAKASFIHLTQSRRSLHSLTSRRRRPSLSSSRPTSQRSKWRRMTTRRWRCDSSHHRIQSCCDYVCFTNSFPSVLFPPSPAWLSRLFRYSFLLDCMNRTPYYS